MKIAEKKINAVSKLFYIKGRLDAHSVDLIEEAMLKELENIEIQNLALDIGEVSYLGSSGIKLFLYLNQKLKSRNGTLVLVKITSSNKRLLDAMGIGEFFEYANSEDEVMELFSNA